MSLVSVPKLGVRPAILEVEREGIRFSNLTPDRVHIEIVVHNRGAIRSEPARMFLSSAPLGVFVPWRPLGSLTVPPLEAGDQVQLEFDANRTPVMPLGEAGRIPPEKLLTALDAEDTGDRAGAPLAELSRPMGRLLGAGAFRTLAGGLAPGIFDLLGHRTLHWAGNINVFVGRRSVERHVARALRVYPGKLNRAVFVVGKKPDAYSFEFEGAPWADYASLVDITRMSLLIHSGTAGGAISTGQWLETSGPLLIGLDLRLPSSCEEGTLVVRVRQRSTGRDAKVEFSLDARAAGPGCFTI